MHVATTLLGQVDAAIGGKTGVNLPEGKNLVGAFWQPAAVLCDTETLGHPAAPREYRSGLGEMAKYHFLGGGERPVATSRLDEPVAACVRIKAEVVAADEREGGRRATLNYGHTLAHALETAGHYDLRHGEAVAIGLVFAAELARRAGAHRPRPGREHRRRGRRLRPADACRPAPTADELVTLMARDKKARRRAHLRARRPAGVEVRVARPWSSRPDARRPVERRVRIDAGWRTRERQRSSAPAVRART